MIRHLFSSNDNSITQTDIVMLLTPRIVRTHELTPEDVSPIHIGTAQNMGISGPPPLIAPIKRPTAETAPESDLEGTHRPDPDADNSAERFLPDLASLYDANVNIAGSDAQIVATGGPYTVPVSISGASQVAALSLNLIFDPSVVRVQTIKEGNFMHQGDADVTFAQNVDTDQGRIELALTRTGDLPGASGSGVLAEIVFKPVAPGSATLSPSGLGLTSGGVPLTLDFSSTTVNVR